MVARSNSLAVIQPPWTTVVLYLFCPGPEPCVGPWSLFAALVGKWSSSINSSLNQLSFVTSAPFGEKSTYLRLLGKFYRLRRRDHHDGASRQWARCDRRDERDVFNPYGGIRYFSFASYYILLLSLLRQCWKEILRCRFLYYNTLKQAVTGSIRSIAPAHAKASLLQLAPVHVPPPYPTSSYPRGPAGLG